MFKARVLFFSFLVSFPIFLSVKAENFTIRIDHNRWDDLLRAQVDKDGYVNYLGIQTNETRDLYAYLSSLEYIDVSTLSEQEKKAFWINAYNAALIKLIVMRPGLRKISDDFDLFKQPFKIARTKLSLNDIENRILRRDPARGGPLEGLSLTQPDPRIRFALSNGSIDGPRLVNRSYTGNTVEAQLDLASREYINNPQHIHLEKGILVMSSIFKWYEDDLNHIGGVVSYINSLLDSSRSQNGLIKTSLQTDFPSKIDFRFDWTLNDLRNKK